MIEVLTAGPFATVQDLGRTAYRNQGVSLSGAMDSHALRMGNLMLGNSADAAGIETTASPLVLRFNADMLFALTGAACAATLGGIVLPVDWCMQAKRGQVLEIQPSSEGMWTYVCVAGGIDCAEVLGSRSTDTKIGIGGPFDGKALSAKDHLTCFPSDPTDCTTIGALGGYGALPRPRPRDTNGAFVVRVLTAREYDDFIPEHQTLFWSAPWQVERESNRMGYRLSGPELQTIQPLSLPSYGLVVGVIQVPPSGQPMIQLAEANTCGGYPKIGVVIDADLPRLVQVCPGQSVRMQRVDRTAALAARRANQSHLKTVTAAKRTACAWS